MRTSFRDLLITGWLIVLAVTVGVVIFHPDYQTTGSSDDLRIGGLASIGALGGILLTRYVNAIGRFSSRSKKVTLAIFAACMIALIPVMVATFALPWGVLIVLTLVYTQWKWAVAATSG
ncbi:MAG: hypothetical protein O3B95_09455 [Chloroflexi bacterium]|nr:hypothetical protein [Chloroflexota bacterium]